MITHALSLKSSRLLQCVFSCWCAAQFPQNAATLGIEQPRAAALVEPVRLHAATGSAPDSVATKKRTPEVTETPRRAAEKKRKVPDAGGDLDDVVLFHVPVIVFGVLYTAES